ncbi:Glycosyl transferase, family 4 [Pandoraea eparura]|uniref:Glycosyl transferase, family 4 n=1 Tax=Pandoraea eparura TaxID=2508291 RepID=A0A5E4WB36_9BURK|nr:glycosyltransferase family 4 protein [Pandoraea eparura]VVE20315.1 Glycosyl transferase, family 4 [Pandoraea eparura]
MIPIVAIIAACLISLGVTAAMRRYALSRQLLDVPNERSSHTISTPRGGGVGIVAAMGGLALTLPWLGSTSVSLALIFGVCGGFVAALGFLDDLGHVPAGWRLLGHFAAATAAVWLAGGLPEVVVFGYLLPLGWIGHVLAVFIVVWMLNLFNFMDGIDGLAGVEAALSGAIGGLLIVAFAGMRHEAFWLFAVAAAAVGFLKWNWPPAKIFMGDAGSGFLGFIFGIAPILAARIAPALFWVMLIIPGVFVVDATVTLVRRLLRGLRPHVAHRSHAYQYASRIYAGHRAVTIVCGLLTACWCGPLAWCVASGRLDGALAVLVTYTPLIGLALIHKAGAPELQGR